MFTHLSGGDGHHEGSPHSKLPLRQERTAPSLPRTLLGSDGGGWGAPSRDWVLDGEFPTHCGTGSRASKPLSGG